MKRLNHMHEDHFLAIFFTCFSLSFLVAAVFMPDRHDMLEGLWRGWLSCRGRIRCR